MSHKHLLFRSEARDKILRGVIRREGANRGLDASTGAYVDLMAAGIIDATKVVRVGLENAVSVAGILLLTEATLTEMPEDKPEAGPHMGP